MELAGSFRSVAIPGRERICASASHLPEEDCFVDAFAALNEVVAGREAELLNRGA